MGDEELGTLEQVDVRRAWQNEAKDFTPWLAGNLDRLAAAVGVELELEDTEFQVGPYRADIVARMRQDDVRVLIENQLGEADLQHLGQVLAYLAGLDARVVIWVAKGFNEAHLSAISWLNEHTADPFSFFAVRVAVVRIGGSPLAPVFEVLERPNEWDRQVQQTSQQGGLSDRGRFRRDFWAHFSSRVPEAPGLRPRYAGSNVWHPIEEIKVNVVQFLAADRVGVYLIGNWGEPMVDAHDRVEPYAARLRKVLLDDVLTDSEHHRCLTELNIDSSDRSNWDRMADWLDDRRRTYERILREGVTGD